MEQILREPVHGREIPRCKSCGHELEGFSTFRRKETSPHWNGGRPIVQLCLGCAKVKDEVEKLMEGMLY